MTYHHEQVGRFYIVAMLVSIVWVAGIAVAAAVGNAPIATLAFVGPVLLGALTVAFGRLNIDVDLRPEATLHWSLTLGWPAGTIPIREIAEAQSIPVSFWMGIGIHLTLRGWVWNVALGQGVQIRKRDGSEIVLGTDDVAGLLAAIERARTGAGP